MELTPQQQSVILGSLLGDGFITNPRYGNSSFGKNQSGAKREYLNWHKQLFGNMACPIREYDNWANGKRYTQVRLRVRSHPTFSAMRKQWYPNGTKIVPDNIKLDPIAIAIWFFDDGSNIVSARRASFATYSFTRPEVKALKVKLASFGIDTTISKLNVITVRTNSYLTLVEMVKPFMLWDCFRHKVAYRESKSPPGIPSEEIVNAVKMYGDGMTLDKIASHYNVSISHISSVIRKRTGASVPLSNSSGVRGVCWDKSRNKWVASYQRDGRRVRVGRFDSKDEAITALHEARRSSTYH